MKTRILNITKTKTVFVNRTIFTSVFSRFSRKMQAKTVKLKQQFLFYFFEKTLTANNEPVKILRFTETVFVFASLVQPLVFQMLLHPTNFIQSSFV